MVGESSHKLNQIIPIEEFNTFRQIGSSFGSAIIGAVLLSAVAANTAKGSDLNMATVLGNKEALLYGAVFAIIGFLISFSLPNISNTEKKQEVASGH